MTPKVMTFTTNTTTGTRTLSGLPYVPSYVRFIVGQKNDDSETFLHESLGVTDFTTKVCHAKFWDGSGKGYRFTDRVINHVVRESGSLVNKIVATTVSVYDNGGGDYRMDINFTATVNGYRVDVELFP